MTLDTQPELIELKPCPFCGGNATCSPCDDSGEVAYAVACMSCLAQITKCDEAGAIEQWNERALPISCEDEVERVARALRERLGWQHGHIPSQLRSEDLARAAIAAMRLQVERE